MGSVERDPERGREQQSLRALLPRLVRLPARTWNLLVAVHVAFAAVGWAVLAFVVAERRLAGEASRGSHSVPAGATGGAR